MPVVIPNIISFIWVGEAIPKRYADNIAEWARINPSYEVHLWTPERLIAQTVHRFVTAFREDLLEEENERIDRDDTETGVVFSFACDTKFSYNIYIDRLETVEPISDRRILDDLIDRWKNYGGASDILRLWVLYKIGGVYMDTDVKSDGRPMPCDIYAPLDILMGSVMFGNCPWHINSIIASAAKEEKLKIMAENIRRGYSQDYNFEEDHIMLTEAAQKRKDRIDSARDTLSKGSIPFGKLRRWRAKKTLDEDFTQTTTERVRGGSEGAVELRTFQDRLEFTFEHMANYRPIIGNDGSWH